MRKLITIKDNEMFLRQSSKEVSFPDENLEKDFEDLKEYTMNNSVFAMASVQIGIPKRLIFVKNTNPNDHTDNTAHITMVNPVILSKKGKTEYLEGCQSCLQYWAVVERPYAIEVAYQDLNGKHHKETFEGFPATVLSHEIDHLDGIFHMDRAKTFVDMDEKDKQKVRLNYPYKVISKDCHFEYGKIKPFTQRKEIKLK